MNLFNNYSKFIVLSNVKYLKICTRNIKLHSEIHAIHSTTNIFDRNAKTLQKERAALRLVCFFFQFMKAFQ